MLNGASGDVRRSFWPSQLGTPRPATAASLCVGPAGWHPAGEPRSWRQALTEAQGLQLARACSWRKPACAWRLPDAPGCCGALDAEPRISYGSIIRIRSAVPGSGRADADCLILLLAVMHCRFAGIRDCDAFDRRALVARLECVHLAEPVAFRWHRK